MPHIRIAPKDDHRGRDAYAMTMISDPAATSSRPFSNPKNSTPNTR
jgi:hypothetical protein